MFKKNNLVNDIIGFPAKIDDWPVPMDTQSELSKRSTPLHSDDEVTPRRGLDEMMSESKLRGLEEMAAGGDPEPLAETIAKKKVEIDALSQDDDLDRCVEVSINKVSPLKLTDTVKQSKGKKLGDTYSNKSSECNLLDSSRKGQSTNRNGRYQGEVE